MSWNHRPPFREEYDSDEEYQEALYMYEWAEGDYADEYVEERQINDHS